VPSSVFSNILYAVFMPHACYTPILIHINNNNNNNNHMTPTTS
jgi:hypothetical protein